MAKILLFYSVNFDIHKIFKIVDDLISFGVPVHMERLIFSQF